MRNTARRRGVSFVEILVLIVLAAVVLTSAFALSHQNMEGQAEMAERTLVQGVALDVLERLKRYKTSWTLPGEVDPDGEAAPADELYGALPARAESWTAMDHALAAQMAVLGVPAAPVVTRVEDPESPGLFRLDVAVTWKPHKGGEQTVRFSRYCYAP